ncbi:MAG: 1,4-alpha-glucan branching enzyme [Candidatus Nitrosomirales archaeon]|jgi:1,4-alpha-glucan branching enzyme
MKILIISDLAPPYMGGIETYVTQLGKHLTKLGHEIHWLTSRIPGTGEYENYHGIYIHRIPILFSSKFVFPGRQTFPFMATLQKLDFVKDMDIVHANTLTAGYSGWRIARKYNKPSLLFCHEFLGDLWKTIGQNVLEKKIYPMMEKRMARAPYDWYACPSEYSKSTLVKAGAPTNKITVIPHGINHDLYNTSGDGSYLKNKLKLERFKLFGYLGRLRVKKTAQSKNLLMLLEATRIVTKEIPDARLVLAGSGYEEIEPFVKKMNLQKHVIYVGNIPYQDNPKFLTMCDLVVCPSLSDGFCFLLAEASVCGKPVVATRLGAHVDRVVDGKTGILADPSAEGIAGAIIQILTNEQKITEFGKGAKNYVEALTWEETARKHMWIYEMLRSKN